MNRPQIESRLGKPRQKVQLVTNPLMTSHDSKGLNPAILGAGVPLKRLATSWLNADLVTQIVHRI